MPGSDSYKVERCRSRPVFGTGCSRLAAGYDEVTLALVANWHFAYRLVKSRWVRRTGLVALRVDRRDVYRH